MSKNHLKRLNAPRKWPISRKKSKWITKSNPGPHKLEESMPLNIILKDLLKYSKTTREVKKILNDNGILVDKVIRKDVKFPVGIFDIIEIPKIKEYFLFLLNNRGKFFLKKINEKQSESRCLKIIGKKVLKKNKLQINFYNGNNVIIENKDYRIGDSLLLNLKDKKILRHLKLEKGATVYLTGGKYVGLFGTIKELSSSDKTRKDMLDIEIDKKPIKTLRKFAFVVDKDIIK
ncbi:30S ribosomal protein S4e [Candidatus Woesearchaeota archaeon]|nr:30S ribosomal protein S4e [Candidatus Woesearchaeota archaeon]